MPESPAKIEGVVPALITPFNDKGELDEQAFRNLIEHQIRAGVDALFIMGSVGEGPLMTPAMCDRVVQTAVEIVDGRLPLLAGASDNSVALCLARLERLASFGADYGVATLPYYGWPGRVQDGVEFFTEVAEASPIPLVAYNLPKAVGWQMPLEMIEQLFEIPNLVCLKDTHADLEAMVAVAASPKRPDRFTYFPGNSGLAAQLMRKGANGVVTTPANVYPEPYVALYRYHCEGKNELADRLDCAVIQKTTKLLTVLPTAASSVKCALEAKGLCTRHTTRPWPMADDNDIAAMKALLREIDEAIESFKE